MTSTSIAGSGGTRVHPERAEGAPALAAAAAVAGVAAVATALVQVATPGPPEASYESLGDFVREGTFLVYLLGSISSATLAWRRGLAPKAAAFLISAGYGLITIGVVIGLALREDLEWFFALGGPGILLSTAGFVTFAVRAGRRSTLPPWLAVLGGVGGGVAIVMAEFGTTVLIGCFWLYVAATSRAR